MPAELKPIVTCLFDPVTCTATYLVADPVTRGAAVIDPVLDYDPDTGRVATRSADAVLAAAAAAEWRIEWSLETHVHADHFSAAPHIKARTGAVTGIGSHVVDVQKTFAPLFGATDLVPDGGDFDKLFDDGARFAIGALQVEVMHTPGHTPACVSYRIGDAVFVGDTIFMPDYGTARTDFPGGDATTLFHSIKRLLALPAETRVFVGHDYKAPGRDAYAWETTVAAERTGNLQIHDGVTEPEFVAWRRERDATLAAPRLLLPSIQVNMRGGRLPPAASNGRRYLVIPLQGAMVA